MLVQRASNPSMAAQLADAFEERVRLRIKAAEEQGIDASICIA